ncbi:GNAT family N-acetyltransferase [Streptacidiphilus fuscans]|uniref:GNAT family N-acetyltransferase n=1 Tax=Streptacidiphilus fuscans TaxID=2789292 RepID=A0A931FJ83_9ACTN|nr:GNAT family N-acetyltransferase [Streptacidiphilus fuscans]MBF9072499.1 GNAT family N-acetyltransferase [Streptacidiphilus fuscans]
MEPTTLETPRLHLRQFTEADIDTITEVCQDVQLQRMTSVPVPYTRAHAEGFVREIIPQGWITETLLNFGVFRKDTDALVASVGIHGHRFRTDGNAEIGYWTAPEQRRQGFTAEAVAVVCDWAFTELDVVRMEWRAVAGNVGSRAVAEKVGFRFEGTLRGATVHRGRRRDAWIGGLLSTDRVAADRLSTDHARRPGRGA